MAAVNSTLANGPRLRAGTRSALAVLARLDRDSELCSACDPGVDESDNPPIRNIVWEHLEGHLARGDEDATRDFCEVLTAMLAITELGCVPSASGIKKRFVQRSTVDRSAAFAREDSAFCSFMEVATTGTQAGRDA